MERRLLEAIKSSEEKVSLKIENAQLRAEVTDLRRKQDQQNAPQ
jgi:hypothetical protein